jgi:hypothetical protein
LLVPLLRRIRSFLSPPDRCFYINTGRFAKTAVEYAAQNQIDLYDGERFPVLVNAAFPVKEDISTARVMCLECIQILTLHVAEAPTSAACDNGQTSALQR